MSGGVQVPVTLQVGTVQALIGAVQLPTAVLRDEQPEQLDPADRAVSVRVSYDRARFAADLAGLLRAAADGLEKRQEE